MDRKLLSIIIPCYNEEKTVETIYATVTDVMTNGQCDYEILFVDDGSKDYTEQKVCGLAQKDRHVKYYSFPEILEKRRQFMQDLIMPEEIML